MFNRPLLITYSLMVVITILGLAVVRAFNISYPIQVTTSTASDLSVIGEGKVEVRPDLATVDAGIVVANAETVKAAQDQINSVNSAIVEALQKLRVDRKDIKTSNYSIIPNQDYNPGGQGRISGYNGNATVTIKIRNVDNVSNIVNAVTQAGANQVFNVNYSVENPDKYREQARNEAISNAKKQAQTLAKTLGISLGEITNFTESASGQPGEMMYRDGMGGGGGNISQPGSQTITSTVTLYFDKR